MNKREYLRSLGFKVGERGRFTDEMKIKLAIYDGVFDEDRIDLKLENLSKFGGKKKQKSNPKNQEQSRGREARTLFGFTKEGTKVGFVNCSNCHEHMVFCNCSEGVHSPSIVTHSKDTLVFVPKV